MIDDARYRYLYRTPYTVYPDWIDKDGNILRAGNTGYIGIFRWFSPAPFDVMVHSTPARTKGHEFEIAIHEEMWAMVAMFKEDLRRQFGL